MAYSSSSGGSLQVFVKPFPDTGAEYQVTQDGGAHPGWSRDGAEIFYRGQNATAEGGTRTLRVVDVTTESGFGIGTELVLPIRGQVTLNDSRDYDIMPDGEQFLMVFPAGQTDPGEPARSQINVVLNWFEELKERVPVP